MSVSVPLLAGSALKSAANSAFRSALPHLLNPWTRKRTLDLLHRELLSSCVSTEQANDLFLRVRDDRTLKRIAALRTVEEVHQLVGSVIHPLGLADPQQQEALILTRALLSALLQATSPGAHAALTSSLLLDIYLKEALPAFSTLLHDFRRRREHPGLSAQADLAELLQRAGQTRMGVAVFADQPAQVVGQPDVEVQITGRNAELFRQWARGGQGATLSLKSEDGEVSVSYGHPELDRMLLPDVSGKPVQYEISEVKTSFRARVRVSAPDEQDVYSAVTIAYAPHTREIDVQFGEAECLVRFRLTHRQEGGMRINVRLHLDSRDRVLPGRYREVLRAMRLLGRPDMQVILPAGETLVRPDGVPLRVERDELLFDGRVWPAGDPSEDPRVEDYLGPIGEVHLMYQKIAAYLEEEEGVDLAQVVVLDVHNENTISLLRRAIAAIERRDLAIPVDLNFNVHPDLGQLLAAPRDSEQQKAVSATLTMTVSGVMDFGARVLQVNSEVQDLTIETILPQEGVTAIQATGTLRDHRLELHPAGAFTRLMSREPAAD